MEAVKMKKKIKNDGELILTNLPYKKGQNIELIILKNNAFEDEEKKSKLTAKKILKSKIVGLWKNRDDITDSVNYAEKLRKNAQFRK
jgi:hypothetical protein